MGIGKIVRRYYPQTALLLLAILVVINSFILFVKWSNGCRQTSPTLPGKVAELQPTTAQLHQGTKTQSPKLVLFYTTLWNRQEWPGMETSDKFVKWGDSPCPVQQCEITHEKLLFIKADVVLFHAFGNDMVSVKELARISKYRHPKQVWVYFIHENPYNAVPRPGFFNGYFNWTMGYQRDADIVVPYNWEWGTWEKRREQNRTIVSTNYAKGKDKLAFAIIGHCGLFRERYIKKLQEYINVDVYGKCSNRYYETARSCKRGTEECEQTKKRYKFYLAFENSFCQDYITEKFHKTLLDGYSVPVVLGGADYKDIAIPNSYIDALDFRRIEDLAYYLKYLDHNDDAYNSYQIWRENYVLGPPRSWSCEICRMINEERILEKTYDNLGDWYSIQRSCGTRTTELFQQFLDSNMTGPFTDEYIH